MVSVFKAWGCSETLSLVLLFAALVQAGAVMTLGLIYYRESRRGILAVWMYTLWSAGFVAVLAYSLALVLLIGAFIGMSLQ